MNPAGPPTTADPPMYDEAPFGLALCDRSGRFLEVSPGLAAILGRPAADVIGMPYGAVLHPADWAAARGWLESSLAGTVRRQRHDQRYVRPDGEVRWVAVTATQPRDVRRTAAAAVLRVVDITDRLRFERRESHLAEAQAIAHLGSWEYDFSAQQTTCSDELFRIFGLDPATAPPDITPLFDWVHLDDRGTVRSAAWASFETGAPFSEECRILRADGAERIVHVQGRFGPEPGGRDRLIGTLQDVTAQRRAEAEQRRGTTAGGKRVGDPTPSTSEALLRRLSTQERHVLERIAAGRTNRQIAEELSLAEKTVRNYASNLLAKLGMHHRSEAAAFAARLEERGEF